MSPLHHAKAGAEAHSGSGPQTRASRWFALLLVTLLGVTSLPVAARMSGNGVATDTMSTAPWDPEVILATSPAYPFNPAFNGGHFIGTDFGSGVGWYLGRSIARLSNGDFVAVGMAPKWGQDVAANGHNNIGLAKFDPTGSLKCWGNPGVYGVGPFPSPCFGTSADPYIVYPNSATPNLEGVRDVFVHNGYIYVLTDQVDLGRTGAGSNNVELQVFKESGEFVDWETVFGAGTTDVWDIYGATLTLGPVVNGNRTLMAVGSAYTAVGWRIIVNRLVIGPDNNAWQDPTFGIAYSNGGNRYVTVRPPDSYCAYADTSQPCQAFAQRAFYTDAEFGGDHPHLYIGGSVLHSDNGTDHHDWNPAVLKMNPVNTVMDADFGVGGWTASWFNDENSDFNDTLVGLAVDPQGMGVYAVSKVSRRCGSGIGVLRFQGDGQLEAGFGQQGKLLFGGSSELTHCISHRVNVNPTDIAVSGNGDVRRIGIVGNNVYPLASGAPVDPMLAVITTTGTIVQSPTAFPFDDANGDRRGNAVLYDVMANADGSFTAIGDGDIGGRYLLALGSFANDVIFRDGFDTATVSTAGALGFVASEFIAYEGSIATVRVQRTGGSTGAVSVRVTTSNGTATTPGDYTAQDVVLDWASGDTAIKSFNIPVALDDTLEGEETFKVTLSNATGGATIAAPATVNVRLFDRQLVFAPQYATNSIKVYRSVPNSAWQYTLKNTAVLPSGTNPNAVALTPDGKIWVVDNSSSHRRLLRFSAQAMHDQGNPAPEAIVTPNGIGDGEIFGIAFHGDHAYVSQSDWGSIQRILKINRADMASSGSPASTKLTNPGKLAVPSGLAFDDSGRLWIANTDGQTIARMNNLDTGAIDHVINSITLPGGARASMSNPEGLAFIGNHTLLVANNGAPTVAAYGAAQLDDLGFVAGAPNAFIDHAPGDPGGGSLGYFGGVAVGVGAEIALNYEHASSLLIYRWDPAELVNTLTSATTNPGFGGLAYWPVSQWMNQ